MGPHISTHLTWYKDFGVTKLTPIESTLVGWIPGRLTTSLTGSVPWPVAAGQGRAPPVHSTMSCLRLITPISGDRPTKDSPQCPALLFPKPLVLPACVPVLNFWKHGLEIAWPFPNVNAGSMFINETYSVLRLKLIRKIRLTIGVHKQNHAVDHISRSGKTILGEALSRRTVFEIPVIAHLNATHTWELLQICIIIYAHCNTYVTNLFRRTVPSHVIRYPSLANAITLPPVTVYELRPATAALDPLKLNTPGITHVWPAGTGSAWRGHQPISDFTSGSLQACRSTRQCTVCSKCEGGKCVFIKWINRKALR